MEELLRSLAEAERGQVERFESSLHLFVALELQSAPPEVEFESSSSDEQTFEYVEIEPKRRKTQASGRSDGASYAANEPAPYEKSAWAIAFTPTFRKAIDAIDRNLRGRLLTAISALAEDPLKVHGDTVKPLTGELQGLWRCRVGDYRLVYRPQRDAQLILLLEFAARGGVYDS